MPEHVSDLSSESQSIRCEVLFIEGTAEQLRGGIKYVVFHLLNGTFAFAAAPLSQHKEIVMKVREEQLVSEAEAEIDRIGGGMLMMSGRNIALGGFSARYGEEPPHVRAALKPVVENKLREMGMLPS